MLYKNSAQRVTRAIHTIRDDPFHSIKELKGGAPEHPLYTFKIGLYYRALLSVHDSVLILHVLEIENRKRSYGDFTKRYCGKSHHFSLPIL